MVLSSLCILVEDRGVLRIRIIDASNSVSPPSFDLSISSTDLHMSLFKLVIVIQALFHLSDLRSLLRGASQLSNAWVRVNIDVSVVPIQNFFGFHKRGGLFLQLGHVLLPFSFEQGLFIRVLVFESLFVSQNLKRRWAV